MQGLNPSRVLFRVEYCKMNLTSKPIFIESAFALLFSEIRENLITLIK